MKRVNYLKKLVSFTFIGCMIAVFFGLPFILIFAFWPEQVPIDFSNGEFKGAGHSEILFMLAVHYLGHCVLTYGIYQFKIALELFYKNIYFDVRVIRALNVAGKGFIASALIWAIFPFFCKIVTHGTMEVGIEFSQCGAIFSIITGLFFLVLSDVFSNAKQLKEENDLTV